jgi:hypothetical protein
LDKAARPLVACSKIDQIVQGTQEKVGKITISAIVEIDAQVKVEMKFLDFHCF